MAIKYEIHYLPNAGGNEETRRFAHIFEQTAMTDKEMISQHSGNRLSLALGRSGYG